jgi:ubiquinone/menaquinone biosynthesis C-methylase UbiE
LINRHLGAWITDVASILPASISLTGVDIQDRLWSPSLVSSYPNISFQLETVTSLPAEWSDTFSLVQQRLLMAALKKQEWYQAIAEIYRVLKPGGWVQLTETTPLSSKGPMYKLVHPEVIVLWEKTGFWLEIEANLPSLLSNEGFQEIQIVKRPLPLSKGGGKTEEMSRQNYREAFLALVAVFVENGWEKEEIEGKIRAMVDEWDTVENQAMIYTTTVVAKKPVK